MTALPEGKRVFLIGTGPLPCDDPFDMGFPAMRTWQVLVALLRDGHEVFLASTVPRDAGHPGEAHVSIDDEGRRLRFHRGVVYADEPGRFLALRDLRRDFDPHVTVTAGPFLPMGAGPRAAGDEPLWVDVPGDPMSEAQARAFRKGDAEPVHRYREMFSFALARGDQFSVISPSQRGLLVGALGLSGRLGGSAMGHELVHVMPASVEGIYPAAGDTPLSPEEAPVIPLDERDFAVLFCGGYNTWLDTATLVDGLLRAMDRDPHVRFVSTGGSVRGHEESTYRAVRERVARSRHRDRFHFLGWVRARALPAVYDACDLALSVDLPCYEAEFGTRTRVLDALEQGLPVASTVLCDLTREIQGVATFHALPFQDPGAVADVVVSLAERKRQRLDERVNRPPSAEGARPGREPRPHGIPWAAHRERHSLASTTRPLRQWVREPERAAAGVPVDFLEDQWAELARLQDRLEEVWKSPTWRYLGRLHAFVKKARDGR